MPSGTQLTMVFISIVVVLGILYDAWVWHRYGSYATISWVTWTTAQKYPLLPFAVGVLAGHLFWVQQTGMLTPWQSRP